MKLNLDLSKYEFWSNYDEDYVESLYSYGKTFEDLIKNCEIHFEDSESVDLTEIDEKWIPEIESLIRWEYQMKKYNGLRLVVNNG
jgi:hypothetical protein